MNIEHQVEQAFARLERQSEPVQEVLRPLLVQVMSEPDTLRVLSNHALADHLMYVAAVLGTWAGTEPSERAPLPPRVEIFLNLTIGRGFDDAEEAYEYVRGIGSEERSRVEEALRIALELPSRRGRRDGLSLLALARLLRLALKRPEAVEHFVRGGTVTPFLNPDRVQQGGIGASAPTDRDSPTLRKARNRRDATALPAQSWIESFNDRLVVVLVSMHGRAVGEHAAYSEVLEYFGRCLEVGTNHMIINTRPDDPDMPEPVLVGLSNVIQMRRVPEEYLAMYLATKR